MLKDYRTYNRGDIKVARTVIIHLYSDHLIINRASERIISYKDIILTYILIGI